MSGDERRSGSWARRSATTRGSCRWWCRTATRLPYRGEYDERRQIVFTKRLLPPSMPSIVVLPLCVHERALGALVLGSRRPKAFGDAVRGTLEVLASHMAVSRWRTPAW